MDVRDLVQAKARAARDAARALALCPTKIKNDALVQMAHGLVEKAGSLLEANRADVERARGRGATRAFLDRLTLTESRLDEMAQGLREIAALPDPVGTVVEVWLLVPVEPLELGFDPFLPSEERSECGCEEANALAERHLRPDATQDAARVLVDEDDLAPKLLRGPRGCDHLVADLDAVLVGDADLELGEQPEEGPAPASRFAAHDRLVSRGIQFEGDDLRSSRQDLRTDGGADVEDVADAKKRDHCTLTIPRPTITLCFEITTGRSPTC